MFKTITYLILSTMVTGIILLVGCASATAVNQPPANTKPITQQPVNSTATNTADNSTNSTQPVNTQQTTTTAASSAQNSATSVNRVDVIYFHPTQRCVTCWCFEQHVNSVMDKYFQDAISSGKLTYKVLNLQEPGNAAIATKYGAVGSQLFVNVIIKGVDNIEDIQSIWNWKCANDPRGFELKVSDVIEKGLREIPQ